jgi:starch synthase
VPGEPAALGAKRAAVFAKAAVAAIDKLEKRPDAIHGHGWVGGLAIAFARANDATRDLPMVLSIHDAKDHGAFAPSDAKSLGLSPSDLAEATRDGTVSALRLGLARAAHVVAPSTTFARSLTTREGGLGLADAYAALGERLVGIANGVDASVWNAATDAKIVNRFDPMDLSGKARDKTHLERVLELPVRDDVPLLVLLANGAPESGFDLFVDIAPTVLRNDCQVVVVFDGAEHDPLRARFQELAERWNDRVAVRGHGDGTLAHEALAAADLVLVPSRVDGSTATHMIAHRYGALPIARRTGVLADTIVDCDAHLETGTGFLYDEPTAEDLLAAVRRGLSAFHESGFRALQARAMRVDHSWERAGRLYERLYRAQPEASR